MPKKTYLQSEPAITWAPSGGTYGITLTSLANNAGRVGARGDLLAYPRAERYWCYMETKVQSGTTVGNLIKLVWSFWSDETTPADEDANVGAADAALGSMTDFYQILPWRTIAVRSTTTSIIQTCSGWLYVPTRYLSPVVGNLSGAALSATAGDHLIRLTAKPPELQ
jgi:hypothetical protein